MREQIQYPIDDMSSTSKDLRTFIQNQWDQHCALFVSNPDSFSALLTAIAHMMPESGGLSNQIEQALQNYHQQYQSAYQALHDLAEQIDKAAQAMNSTDQSIKDSFKSS